MLFRSLRAGTSASFRRLAQAANTQLVSHALQPALLYLALALASGAVSVVLLALWPLLLLANPLLWAASAVVAAFVLVEAPAIGWPRAAGCLAATGLLGPGCGLALFLFLREPAR